MAIDVIDIVRIDDGKFVEHWGVADMAKMMQQLSPVGAPGVSAS